MGVPVPRAVGTADVIYQRSEHQKLLINVERFGFCKMV